ncbi:cyclin-dependent kinases regulatory subunit 1-like isoform X2 [Saccostrea cucullata]|uniref:cyclin-dependent kinases regulatory subunit 1-like isoform X2 n=1 Tax=Saccostrea cuccullata TaxID=36930 RepID=UPI002ED1F04B
MLILNSEFGAKLEDRLHAFIFKIYFGREMAHKNIYYSDKYTDEQYEYRHVMLPKEIAKLVPNKLMTETEWRSLGVQQSQGWIHYMKHEPEPHILLFRRPLPNHSHHSSEHHNHHTHGHHNQQTHGHHHQPTHGHHHQSTDG